MSDEWKENSFPPNKAKVEFRSDCKYHRGEYTNGCFWSNGKAISANYVDRWREIKEEEKPHWICICGKKGFYIEGETFSDHIKKCGGFSTVQAVYEMKTEAYERGYTAGLLAMDKLQWRDLYPFSKVDAPCLLRNKKGSLPFTCYSEEELRRHIAMQEEMKLYLQYIEIPK